MVASGATRSAAVHPNDSCVLGTFASTEQAWIRRVQSGQAGQQMSGKMASLGSVAFENFADWTDRTQKASSLTPRRSGRRAPSATSW